MGGNTFLCTTVSKFSFTKTSPQIFDRALKRPLSLKSSLLILVIAL